MTTETTTPVAAPAAAKPAKAPKAKTAKSKKPAAKKAAKGKKPTKKAERKPREKKEGLRKVQVAVLRVLAKAGKPMTKKAVAEKAETDPSKMGVYIGPREGESQHTSETWNFPGLYELGFVRIEKHEGEPAVCSITAKGRKALEDHLAAEKAAK